MGQFGQAGTRNKFLAGVGQLFAQSIYFLSVPKGFNYFFFLEGVGLMPIFIGRPEY